jgi:hypothetical protein
MLDRFRRRPNTRDREALELRLAEERQHRRDELLSSSAGLAVLLALSLLLVFVFRLDDIWFPLRPAWWIQLAESVAFFAAIAAIGISFGLPGKTSGATTRYFDRQLLRATRDAIEELDATLNGEVNVLRCDATDVVAFGDDEDDVEWYAFQIAPDRLFFLDDLTAAFVADDAPFPNTSFEIIGSATDADHCIAVHCLGKRLRVRRLLPMSALPEDVGEEQEGRGRLDDLMPPRPYSVLEFPNPYWRTRGAAGGSRRRTIQACRYSPFSPNLRPVTP